MDTAVGENIYEEVLHLAERHCGKGLTSRYLRDQKKARRREKQVLQELPGPERRYAPLTPEQNPDDVTSIDHLLTMCRDTLPTDKQYQNVLIDVGNILKLHAEYGPAEKMFTDVLSYGRAQKCNELIVEALLQRGDIFSRQGRWKESGRDLRTARDLASRLGDLVALARTSNILGTSDAEQGDLTRAKRQFVKALGCAERAKRESLEAVILMNLGVVHNIIGDYDEAFAYYRRALSRFERTGEINRIAEIHHNTGMTHLSRGEYMEALRSFDQSIHFAVRTGDQRLAGISQLEKATIHFKTRDHALALALCNSALEQFKHTSDRLGTADAYKVKGMILREMKEYDPAMTFFQSSLRINEEYNNRLNQGETHYEIGIMQQSRRKWKEAVAAFKSAKVCFKRVGACPELEKTENRLKQLKERSK
ncbi:MAG TPA: tetratricopeptide repeat protein [Bacteroidota bacterium]|nr:tetratricopeptide repeat protein [Bacteroidota bacterium]